MVENYPPAPPPMTRRQRSKMHPWSGFAEYLCFGCFEILIASGGKPTMTWAPLGRYLVELAGNFWIGACARFIRDGMMVGCTGG